MSGVTYDYDPMPLPPEAETAEAAEAERTAVLTPVDDFPEQAAAWPRGPPQGPAAHRLADHPAGAAALPRSPRCWRC